MRFNCGPSYSVRMARLRQWHTWFAWYPVRVEEGDCRWLEFIERRDVRGMSFMPHDWQYRVIEEYDPEEHQTWE